MFRCVDKNFSSGETERTACEARVFSYVNSTSVQQLSLFLSNITFIILSSPLFILIFKSSIYARLFTHVGARLSIRCEPHRTRFRRDRRHALRVAEVLAAFVLHFIAFFFFCPQALLLQLFHLNTAWLIERCGRDDFERGQAPNRAADDLSITSHMWSDFGWYQLPLLLAPLL